MAGLDSTVNSAEKTSADASMPSLPLYVAGFVITLCGILAANAALTSPDYGWMTSTLMLSGLGFLFSYGSRRLGIVSSLLDYGFAGFALILLACIATHQLSLVQFLPAGADRPDLRLLSALVWSGTLWSWALRSDNRVALATIPTMAVLGMAAEIDVNTPVMVCFAVFILTVIFLLIHQNFLQNRGRATRSETSPTQRLLLAQLVQAGLCGVAVLLAGMLVIVPAQVLFSHLSLAQAIRHLAAIQPDHNEGATVQRFSDEDNLSIGTGDAWSASSDVVMRVTPSDGQPHYWRGRTYDVYTGDGWQSSQENDQRPIGADASSGATDRLSYTLPSDLTPGDPVSLAGRLPLAATFEVRGQTNQFYYADTPTHIVFDAGAARDLSGALAWPDGRLGLVSGGAIRFPYRVVSLPPPDLAAPGVAEHLRHTGTQYPDTVRSLYLKQSTAVQSEDIAFYQQCVTAALQNLPANQRDPLDEAEALRNWVSKRCVYTLTPPPLPDDTDHVHAFLGDTRKGYCDMFASSLAVLCRTAGIPARLAVGFAPGDPDGTGFNLRAEDKHAWTEVYFPGTGWIGLDATAGTQTDGTVPGGASSSKSSWLSRFRLNLGSDWLLVYPLVGLILAIAVYIAKTELYDPWRGRRRSAAVPNAAACMALNPQIAQPYARLCQSLARLGLPRRLSETPAEYAARILPELPPLEREWNVSLPSTLVSALTLAFTEALYADPSIPASPVQSWNTRCQKRPRVFRQKPIRTMQ